MHTWSAYIAKADEYLWDALLSKLLLRILNQVLSAIAAAHVLPFCSDSAGSLTGQERRVVASEAGRVGVTSQPVGVEGKHIEDDLDDGHRNPDRHEQSHHLVAPGVGTVQHPHQEAEAS